MIIRKHLMVMAAEIRHDIPPEIIAQQIEIMPKKFNESLTRQGYIAVTEPKLEIIHHVYLPTIGDIGTMITIKNKSIRKKWHNYLDVAKSTPASRIIITKQPQGGE